MNGKYTGKGRPNLISFRMSPEEARELNARATEAGITRSDYIRNAIEAAEGKAEDGTE